MKPEYRLDYSKAKPNRYRQFEALQERTLERLRYRIPHDCPLRVERRAVDIARREFSGFRAIGPDCEMIGRAAVVTAFIDGYVAAWRQSQPPESEP